MDKLSYRPIYMETDFQLIDLGIFLICQYISALNQTVLTLQNMLYDF